MTREEIQNEIEDILSRNGFLTSEAKNFFEAMNEMLYFLADETEKSEPFAINTIEAFRESANNIGDYDSVIDGLVSDEDEEIL